MADGVTCLVAFGVNDIEVVCRLFRSPEAGIAWCDANLTTLNRTKCLRDYGAGPALRAWEVPNCRFDDSEKVAALFQRYYGGCGGVSLLVLATLPFDSVIVPWDLD